MRFDEFADPAQLPGQESASGATLRSVTRSPPTCGRPRSKFNWSSVVPGR
jgi:hypothetical protein